MACAVLECLFSSLILSVAGARGFIRYFRSLEISLGFTVIGYLCREFEVYCYSMVNPFPYVWEELFSYGSLIIPFTLFLPFLGGFTFEFTVCCEF